jgi:hypothetical protein
LSDGIQAFFATAGFVLHLNENNCNGTNRLEVIFHPAFSGDTTLNEWFRQVLKGRAKYGNKAVKDLRAKV